MKEKAIIDNKNEDNDNILELFPGYFEKELWNYWRVHISTRREVKGEYYLEDRKRQKNIRRNK